MVLGEDGEDEGRRTCGEVVECVEGERAEEEGEEQRGHDCGECEGCRYERL